MNKWTYFSCLHAGTSSLVANQMSSRHSSLSRDICLLRLIGLTLNIGAAGLIRRAKVWVKALEHLTARKTWADIPHSHSAENV